MNDFNAICEKVSKNVQFEILPSSLAYEQFESALYVYLHTFVLKLALLEPEPNNHMDSFFIHEHDLETFCVLLMNELKIQQNIKIRDIYTMAYKFMQINMPYNFPKITTKNKIISRVVRSLTTDPGLDWRLIQIYGEKAAEPFCYSKNNINAIVDLSVARASNAVYLKDISNQEKALILKKNGVFNVLANCYYVFKSVHRELFMSFNESETNLYQELDQLRKKIRKDLQQRYGENYMQLLVGYLFIDINLPIVRVVCNDLDFQSCYHIAMGIEPKKHNF